MTADARPPGLEVGASAPRAAREPGTSVGQIGAWLERFEAAVRAGDLAGGRALFAPDAIAFGTRAGMARGVEAIEVEQWRHVWPRIHDFRLRDPVVRVHGDQGWVATLWETQRVGADGTWQPRPGRGTFVLERRAGRWVAVHSHFSLLPEDPHL